MFSSSDPNLKYILAAMALVAVAVVLTYYNWILSL